MNKYIMIFENWVGHHTIHHDEINKNFPITVGNVMVTEEEYRKWYSFLKEKYSSEKELEDLQDDGFDTIEDYCIHKLDNHINLLNNYWNNGGELYRLVFTDDVNTENLGNHWTHSYDVLELINDELRIEGESKIIEGIIKPHSIDIKQSLELFYWNSEQEEIYVSNPENISIIKIDKW